MEEAKSKIEESCDEEVVFDGTNIQLQLQTASEIEQLPTTPVPLENTISCF